MKEGSPVTEELDLIKLIYKEIKNIKEELNEKIDTKFAYLEKKTAQGFEEVQESFKCLDVKVDNTRKLLVIEISEKLNDISIITTNLANDLETKINNEINDRKIYLSKINDFNKIILNDIGGRVSILEEENEKYNLN